MKSKKKSTKLQDGAELSAEGAALSMPEEQAEALEQLAAETRRLSRTGYMPEQWENSYGLPVEEHSKALQVDIKEGYAHFDTFPEKKTQAGEGGTNAGE